MASESLAGHLAQIARRVQSGHDLANATEEICGAALDLVPGAEGAGVTLVHGRDRVETVSASADFVREGDELQYRLQEGPCLDASWEDEQVYAGDLSREERWPTWAPRVARELGMHSMLCTQLFTSEESLGALNLYSREREAFDAEDLETTRLLAAHAAVAVAAAQQIDTLRTAVDRRATIGKALGVIMCRYDLDDDRALAVLRRLSSHENRKLYDVAVDVVAHMRLPGD